jgi:GST-like protein
MTIRLYTYPTPNGRKASIMLEETGLPYTVQVVDIERGDQRQPEFLALNPNNKIPVIVDPERGRTVFESGAILFYLAERSGVLQPATDAERGTTLQWVLFQAAHVGPTLGQVWNWKIFADETLPPVIARFEREADRVLRVLDGRLAGNVYLAGDRYGIADVMTWPWIQVVEPALKLDLAPYRHLRRWFDTIAARPAVQHGAAVPELPQRDAAA